MTTEATDRKSIADLAASHGLDVVPESISLNELGLDFRVAFAETDGAEKWVLRIPRRADVAPRAAVEGRLLDRIQPHLDVAIPNWRIHAADLIAYPLLPGEPGLTIGEDGEPAWHFDVESDAFAHSLGDLLAQLHSIDPEEVSTTGIDIRTAAETRQGIRDDIARVSAEFAIAADLLSRWRSWLADDDYWPTWSVLTHGEVYPAHLLLTDEKIVGVLDWTTAAIGDPARDFVFHRASVSDRSFDATVRRYVERGGRVWPKLAEHCTELYSTSPLAYGLYALTTGDPAHVEAAAAQLGPQ